VLKNVLSEPQTSICRTNVWRCKSRSCQEDSNNGDSSPPSRTTYGFCSSVQVS